MKAIIDNRKHQETESPNRLFDRLSVKDGKRTRLWHLLYGHGPGNGTLLILPLDHGCEHGPSDFFANPEALDTDFQLRLALEARYSAIAMGIGLAEKYMREYSGRVPLILKLNGKTNIPDDGEAVSPLVATVRDAVRLGADAVGYTLYVGSPRQREEMLQFRRVREDCERFGMPIVLWFGRNVWQRPYAEALLLTRRIHGVLEQYSR